MTGYRTRSPALERSISWLQRAFLRPPEEALITYAWKATTRVVSLAAVSVSPRNASPVERRYVGLQLRFHNFNILRLIK